MSIVFTLTPKPCVYADAMVSVSLIGHAQIDADKDRLIRQKGAIENCG